MISPSTSDEKLLKISYNHPNTATIGGNSDNGMNLSFSKSIFTLDH